MTRVDLRTDLPDALCSSCQSILYGDDPMCLDCGSPKPREGWPEIAGTEDRWLGRSLAGRWLVSRRLGQGATSAVYRVDSLHRPRRFALKIIDLDEGPGTPEEIWERARVEVSVVQSAENPHIVAIHELLQPTRRHVAILMEYVEGRTLREISTAEGPLPPGRVVEILRQIALGLREVHARGVVHRDIKPSNVLVERLPSGEDLVRLTDFGIARVPGSFDENGGFIGTPLYASPEQVVGDSIDHRSDIYSLGALTFRLLTGVPPFRRDSHVKVMQAHVSAEPPRLSDVGSFVFSRALEGFVRTMLHKRATERPQNVEELVRSLEALREHSGWDAVEQRGFHHVADDEPVTVQERPRARVQPPGHCMVPFEIQGNEGIGDQAALAAGRVVVAAGDEIILTTLVPRRRFRRAMDVQAEVSAVGLTEQHLLLGLANGDVVAVDVDGTSRTVFQDPHERRVSGVATDRACRVTVVGTSGGVVHLRTSPEEPWRAIYGGRPVTAVAVTTDGSRFAVARDGSGVEVYESWSPDVPVVEIPRERVTSLAFARDGHLLATGQETGMTTVWAVETRTPVHTIARDRGEVLSIAFADETLLGLVREGSQAYLVDLRCRFGGVCAPGCTRCHLQSVATIRRKR
jgi:hypothetical protein